MIPCPTCGKTNSLDSRFCRECGDKLPEEQLWSAQEDNLRLIGEGQKLLLEGRVDEAMLIAQTALQAEPDLIPALALLGDCYERGERYADALAQYERILEVKPDSPLDRVRVAHLRKMLAAQSEDETEPKRRRQALLAGAATCVLFVAVGITLLMLNERASAQTKSPQPAPAEQTPGLVAQATPGLPGPAPTAAPNPDPATTATNPAPAAEAPRQANPGTSRPGPSISSLPGTGGYAPFNPLPGLSGIPGAIPGSIGFSPVNPQNTTPPPTGPDRDPAPIMVPGGGEVAVDPDPGPGEIYITPSTANPGGAGSAPVTNPGEGAQEAETLVRVAREQFQLGNYSKAAELYAQAIRAGADPGFTNQRLALCYDRLGRAADAIAAYRRAIAAFERRLESGSGDTARIQTAIDTCNAAIRALGG